MSYTPPRVGCAVESCPAEADWRTHAVWTSFDFDSEFTCKDHVWLAQMKFVRRHVDGQPVAMLTAEKVIKV